MRILRGMMVLNMVAPKNLDRKSTRLNSSHQIISYAVFCLKKKNRLLHSTRQLISYADFCLNTNKMKHHVSDCIFAESLVRIESSYHPGHQHSSIHGSQLGL